MIWFVVLYLIGAFIRLHLDIDRITSKRLTIIFSISLMIIFTGSLLLEYLNLLLHVSTSNFILLFSSENSIFTLITSIALFLIFLKQSEFSNRYVNYIAGSILGVYLIHDNMFVRQYLWKYILHNPSHYYSSDIVLFAIISIISVYIISTAIDIVRRLTVEKIWIWIIDSHIHKWISDKFDEFENRIDYYLK